jgi:hypothetical protein
MNLVHRWFLIQNIAELDHEELLEGCAQSSVCPAGFLHTPLMLMKRPFVHNAPIDNKGMNITVLQ